MIKLILMKENKFFLDISKGKNHNYKLSECSKESGESVLNALNLALDLAKENKIDAINFGPFNKTSLKLGGNKFSDELHLMAEKLEVKNFFVNLMLWIIFGLRVLLLTYPLVKFHHILKKKKLLNQLN